MFIRLIGGDIYFIKQYMQLKLIQKFARFLRKAHNNNINFLKLVKFVQAKFFKLKLGNHHHNSNSSRLEIQDLGNYDAVFSKNEFHIL